MLLQKKQTPIIKGLLFDLDGVLIHSNPIHQNAFKTVLSKYGSFHFQYAELAGMTTDRALRNVLEKNGVQFSESKINQMIQEKRELAFQGLNEFLPVDSDAERIIGNLFNKYQLALASSASRRVVDLFLSKTGTTHLFQAVVCGDDVQNGKPSPDIFLTAAGILKLDPEYCMVIEDSKSGITAAHAAGMKVILRRTCGDKSLENLEIFGSVEKLSELLNVL